MNFWGSIGKGLKGLLTGGSNKSWADNLPGLVSAGASAVGAIQTGREKGRAAENAGIVTQDQQRQKAAQDFEDNLLRRGELDLTRRKFSRDSENDSVQRALASSLLKNLVDVKLTMPKDVPVFDFGGGLRPSALGSGGREVGDLMYQKAMQRLMDGEKFEDLPELSKFDPTALKQGGVLDAVLGGVGMAGRVGDQLYNMREADNQNTLIKRLLAQLGQQRQVPQVVPTDLTGEGLFGGQDLRATGMFGR